jgi:hypothetical protein
MAYLLLSPAIETRCSLVDFGKNCSVFKELIYIILQLITHRQTVKQR